MAHSSPAYSRASIAWLQEILRERISTVLVLERHAGKWTLRAPSNPTEIVIDSAHSRFDRQAGEVTSALWDAEAEGFAAPQPGRELFAPGATRLGSPLIVASRQGSTIGYDLLGLTHWMLSRQEEIASANLDRHGRFPAIASHAYRHGYLDRPVVDEWLQVLMQLVERQWPGLPRTELQPSTEVSHDVDVVSRYGFLSPIALARAIAVDAVKHGDWLSLVRGPAQHWQTRRKLCASDTCNTFDWLMDVAECHGRTSAFFFLCGRTDPSTDAAYDIGHPTMLALLGHIHERGHEIGLHPSYGTYRDPQALAAEADRLRWACKQAGVTQERWGARLHYLRWEMPTTLHALEQAGMHYDATLGYADRPGFRCGTCIEYPAFDPIADKALQVRIRPLVAMEISVMDKRYLGLGCGEAAMRKFAELKQACSAVGGCFSVLWHNNRLDSRAARELFEAVIA